MTNAMPTKNWQKIAKITVENINKVDESHSHSW